MSPPKRADRANHVPTCVPTSSPYGTGKCQPCQPFRTHACKRELQHVPSICTRKGWNGWNGWHTPTAATVPACQPTRETLAQVGTGGMEAAQPAWDMGLAGVSAAIPAQARGSFPAHRLAGRWGRNLARVGGEKFRLISDMATVAAVNHG